MTRWYIVILNEKKIKRLVYSNSDSYFCKDENLPAGLVLKAMQSEDILAELNKRMDELVKSEYLTEEDFFKEDDENKFYIKTKKNEENFFVDYVYEYNIKTKKLTVYCFGKKKIQFTKNDIEYMDYLFGDNTFDQEFSYNEDTLKYDNDSDNIFTSFMKERRPIAEIESQSKGLIAKHRISIEWYNTADCFGPYHYKKSVNIHDNDGKIIHTFKFCVAPLDNYSSFVNSTPPKEYQMNIQLPYCRSNIFYVKKNGYRPSYYSKKALEKTFIEYYIKNKNVQEELIKAVPLYKIYKKYHEDFTTLLEKVEVLNNKEEQLEVLRKEKAPFPTK